jgi:hypothetical protein
VYGRSDTHERVVGFGEATFVSQVLRIGHGENIACHEKLIQLA